MTNVKKLNELEMPSHNRAENDHQWHDIMTIEALYCLFGFFICYPIGTLEEFPGQWELYPQRRGPDQAYSTHGVVWSSLRKGKRLKTIPRQEPIFFMDDGRGWWRDSPKRHRETRDTVQEEDRVKENCRERTLAVLITHKVSVSYPDDLPMAWVGPPNTHGSLAGWQILYSSRPYCD